MRSLYAGGLALALCVLSTPALAQKEKAARVTSAEAEYKTLLKGYNAAEQRFYEPVEKAKTDAERRKVRIDEAKNPAHAYLPRFQALARREHRNETGAKSLLEIMELAFQVEDTKVALTTADSLIADHIASPSIQQAAVMISYINRPPDVIRAAQLLQKIVDRSTNHSNKAAAIYSLASLYTEGSTSTAAQKAEAKSLLAQITADYSDTPFAKSAVGSRFQLENLQIGMTAPDFEATDEAGQKFKLSDYRGKVVMVDFWGFW